MDADGGFGVLQRDAAQLEIGGEIVGCEGVFRVVAGDEDGDAGGEREIGRALELTRLRDERRAG
jgi:hypothetical protein